MKDMIGDKRKWRKAVKEGRDAIMQGGGGRRGGGVADF